MSQQGPEPPGGPPQPTGPQWPGWSPQPQAPQVVYVYPQAPNRGTNGFAIASLICAFLCAPLGLVFGFIAKSQIKQNGEGGDGLATAGIVVSAVFLVLGVLYFILLFAVFGAVLHSLNDFNNFHFSPIPAPTPVT